MIKSTKINEVSLERQLWPGIRPWKLWFTLKVNKVNNMGDMTEDIVAAMFCFKDIKFS